MLGAWARVDEPSWDLRGCWVDGWLLGGCWELGWMLGLRLMSRAGIWVAWVDGWMLGADAGSLGSG
jgi:hypothetical protein